MLILHTKLKDHIGENTFCANIVSAPPGSPTIFPVKWEPTEIGTCKIVHES